MKRNEWTPSQQNALDARGMNLLVSAGAGSGKTTVLTHRILERIRNGDSVTDFLVVTFTKASANDLKRKLYEEITALSVANPNEKHYRTQTYELPSAHISTIHSYCLEVVRANFQTLGISPKVRMADDQETRMIAADVMETVTEAFYDAADEGFHLLADTFSGQKDDAPLQETMLDLYNRLRAYTDYFGWLETQADNLFADARLTEGGFFCSSLGKELQKRLTDWFGDLARAADALYLDTEQWSDTPAPIACAKAWADCMHLLEDGASQSYTAFLEAAEAFRSTSFPQMRFGKTVGAEQKEHIKAERDRIKEECERLLKIFAVCSERELIRQLEQTGYILRAITVFLRRFEDMFDQTKREKGVLDFADAEHFLLRLLEKDGRPTSLCLSMREKIKEIYIDEYQDVSPLQDRLFTLLSRGNNRFMVGDVKQSIYRFRNAYPDIFLGYKDAYPDYAGDSGQTSARIFLRENFRSGKGVIDFTNLLFSLVTRGTPNEREYKGEELVFQKKTDAPYQPVTVAVAVDEEGDKAAAVEQEAAYIAEEIVRLVENGRRETKDGLAPYRYQDIALLFRSLKGKTAPYERALKARGIPYTVSTPERFFDRAEIQLMIALLKTLDDPTDDISLFAALRSPIFQFSDEELYTVRLCDRCGILYRALQKCAEQTGELAKKCGRALQFLSRHRERAEGKPCHTFLWELYTESGLPAICKRSEKNGLLMLYEYARSFEKTGFKGLSGFIAYLQAAKEKNVELPSFAEGGDADRVMLTTIHKSKGLEYPAVFLCATAQPMFPNRKQNYILLRDKGLFFKLRDYERLTVTDTLVNRYGGILERDAELGEELRKLYVACTRAKEKLYITGAVSRKALDTVSFDRRSPKCMLDFVLYTVLHAKGETCFELQEIAKEETALHRVSEQTSGETRERFLTDEVKRSIAFVYPHAQNGLPAKVSVSYLKETVTGAERVFEQSHVANAPRFIGRADHTDSAARGTANHTFLQFCDFDYIERNGLQAEIGRLRQKRMLDDVQFELLDLTGLQAFFASDLYRRMRASAKCFREMRFSVRTDASVLQEGAAGEVLLQGVIDCFFEDEDGKLRIVDYKTDRVTAGEELIVRHKKQLELYRDAVEKMTGKEVICTSIWSFALQKEILFPKNRGKLKQILDGNKK